ncbi:uncharacterized protein LOC143174990 isoform X2 [Nomia melanderi]|uniref:uncharacterized protein LOC143174990 isoform X2 n=1 Tax=Nomia melanderi TaxID=2448451 RepID=UPI003FCE5A6E
MIEVTVKTLDSQNHAFTLEDDQITVRDFKEHIAEAVSVPAETQRLIYCGKVLRNEKKLNDYDVNGKVIHLVQLAPPQPGQRRNDEGHAQTQTHTAQVLRNPRSTRYRLARTQMHGNAMYVGAMSVPAEIIEGPALPVPQLSNSLSNSRLVLATRMLQRANVLVERLANPNIPLHPPSSESNQSFSPQQAQTQQAETEHFANNSRASVTTRLTEATAAAIAAALSATGANNVTLLRGNSRGGIETVLLNDNNEDNQSESQQSQEPQSEQQGPTSRDDEPSDRLPRPRLMADLLEQLMNAQNSLRPYIESYRALMVADKALPTGGGPGSVEESQRIVDGVSEGLHYISHACHALSDIIVDMGQQPPRNLRCRPIIIQQSAILQPGAPIQVEAHFSIHGQNAYNNNRNEENSDSANTTAQSELNETNTEENSQHQEPESGTQRQPESQQQQEQAQPPFGMGTIFNLPNDMVLMEVSPEGNFTTGSEQLQTGENNNNNNNNNGGRINSAADLIRNIMQAVAGHIVPAGITTTTITTPNLPTAGGQQTNSSHDGNTNAGQSTQARSNVDTHPTTATQTRSTSRQQAHSLNLGMNLDQGLEFDPFLPCNSHHVRRLPPATSHATTSTSQRVRPSQASATESQPQAQTATTSATTTSNTNSINTMASSSQASPFMRTLQQTLGEVMEGQQQATFGTNSNIEVLDLVRQMILFTRPSNDMAMETERDLYLFVLNDLFRRTVAEILEPLLSAFSQDSMNEGVFLLNLTKCVFQDMTLLDMRRLHHGQWKSISRQRVPLIVFLKNTFPDSSGEELPEQIINRALSEIRPKLQSLFATAEVNNGENGLRIDICATIEALLQRHIRHIVQLLFDNDINDITFAQETFNILQDLKKQLLAVLEHSIHGGLSEFVSMLARFGNERVEGLGSFIRPWSEEFFISANHNATQPPDSEILPLLIYEDVPSSQLSEVSSDSTQRSSQAQPEVEPMETEVVEEKTNFGNSLPDDNAGVPEAFPVLEALPSDWVPIIARDNVRQRRQLLTQGMTNGSVTTLSDAYLDTLPTKRRKLIEQQKPRLLVSTTPNHSAISASMERLVRESVKRAGVEEVDGAAVAVASDPSVRRAFGQAIRDCLNPRRYETPDFPDSLRFPNATKYFADQDRSPK